MTFLQNSLPRRCESIDKLSNASQICPVPMINVLTSSAKPRNNSAQVSVLAAQYQGQQQGAWGQGGGGTGAMEGMRGPWVTWGGGHGQPGEVAITIN